MGGELVVVRLLAAAPLLLKLLRGALTATPLDGSASPHGATALALVVQRRYRGPIKTVSACMPADARERWLDLIAEALHDFPPEEHRALLRDFLLHAPATVAAGWAAQLRRARVGSER